MKVEIHRARKGVVAQWFVADDTLKIYLADDLDDLARQRYIAQAKLEHGITDERRRRGLIALLPLGWGHTAGSHKAAATAVAGGGALVVGVAAALVLPAVLEDDSQRSPDRPRAAAPAKPPSPPKSSQKPKRPGPPHGTPIRPGRSADPPQRGALPAVPALHLPPDLRHPIGRTLPVGDAGSVSTPPHLPKPPTPPKTPRTRARTLLRVDLPPVASVSVRLSPQPQIKVRLGSKQP